jgi:hypothetical protein
MRFFFSLYCLTWIHLASIPARAQNGAVGVPGLGFAQDSRSNQIRPIYGVPGAAVLGDAAGSSTGFSYSAISPRHDLALAVSTADRQVYAVRLQGDGTFAIPGADAAPSQIVFSPLGRAAVLVGDRLQALTGLPASLTLTDLALPSSTEEVGAIAIADDAQLVLLASKAAGSDRVWLLVPGAAPFPLPFSGPVAAAAFRPDSHDVIAASPAGDIYLIRNPGPGAEVRLVYAGDERTLGPVAIRLSADGGHAYTANSKGILSTVDLLAGSAVSAACQCLPTGLYPMHSDSLFRVTEITDAPMMLFDASSSVPRVWFVPPDGGSASPQRSAQ